MMDISKLLYDICNDEHVFEDDFDLIESGLLDSFAIIELFSKLEDYGILIHPTRIDRNSLRTPASIKKMIEENNKLACKQ